MRAQTVAWLWAVLLLGAVAAGWCQEESEDPGFFPNFIYASQLGVGAYQKDELTVKVARLPIGMRLRSVEDGWGLRLQLPVIFGRFELDDTAAARGVPADRLELDAVSFVPALTAEVPAGRRWLLLPKAGLGYGRDLHGGEEVLMWTAALGGRARWQHGDTLLTFGSALTFAGNRSLESDRRDRYASLDLGFEARFPIAMRWGGAPADIGPWVAQYLFFGDLELVRYLDVAIVTGGLYEVGFAVGPREPARRWGVPVPRLGVSYRFGSGVEGWFLNFGFPL
ncbi:MAG: hypothetical protein R3190_13910 [Thermoanaerobaculia bacterium]|nr:hypothetical protein [Thermoanaerobaculia bacterium]